MDSAQGIERHIFLKECTDSSVQLLLRQQRPELLISRDTIWINTAGNMEDKYKYQEWVCKQAGEKYISEVCLEDVK